MLIQGQIDTLDSHGLRLAAISGYASITIPAGDILGLPIGVSFIGGDSAMRSLSGSPMRLSREDTDADRRHWIDASEHVLEKN